MAWDPQPHGLASEGYVGGPGQCDAPRVNRIDTTDSNIAARKGALTSFWNNNSGCKK